MTRFKQLFEDLSLAQVLAGALAASTAAFLSSKIGIAGTIIGVGFGSLVGSVASTLYKHSMLTSQEVIREVVVKRKSLTDEQEEETLNALERGEDPPEGVEVENDSDSETLRVEKQRKSKSSWMVIAASALVAFVITAMTFLLYDTFFNPEADRVEHTTTIIREPTETSTTIIVEPTPTAPTIVVEPETPTPTETVTVEPEPAPTATVTPEPEPEQPSVPVVPNPAPAPEVPVAPVVPVPEPEVPVDPTVPPSTVQRPGDNTGVVPPQGNDSAAIPQ